MAVIEADLSSLRFGALWASSEVRQLLTRRWLRVSGALAGLFLLGWLGVVVQAFPLLLSGTVWAWLALGLVAVALAGLWWAVQCLAAAMTWASACRRWVVRTPRGLAAAAARPSRRGGWRVVNVVARPTGLGVGRELLTVLVEDADLSGTRLELDAVNRDAERFYSRFGFAPVRSRTWSGTRMIRSAGGRLA